jgi:hypothetical protein
MRNLLVWSGMLAAGGCALSEDRLPDALANAACDRILECNQAFFEDEYTDMEECLSEQAEVAEDLLDFIDGGDGEYSSGGAKDCVKAIREVSCSDFNDAEYLSDCEEEDIYP